MWEASGLSEQDEMATIRRIDLQRAIAKLTNKQLGVLALWLEGYTQEEIAERCGVKQCQVSQDMAVIRALLRANLT